MHDLAHQGRILDENTLCIVQCYACGDGTISTVARRNAWLSERCDFCVRTRRVTAEADITELCLYDRKNRQGSRPYFDRRSDG